MEAMKEKAIRAIVGGCVEAYASGFSARHLAEVENENGVINMKMHNVFIAALDPEIRYYSALARSLDSSLGSMLEKMAIRIAELNYQVLQHVEGVLYKQQTDFIAELLEQYKNNKNRRIPKVSDYEDLINMKGDAVVKRHESDYYLIDEETDIHYLIELKSGGDLDNKKARSEKEALLEQYCILCNQLGTNNNVKLVFATAYNKYGEGFPWIQGRVRQFFSEEELCIGRDFWNMVCKSEEGYKIVIDELSKHQISMNNIACWQ